MEYHTVCGVGDEEWGQDHEGVEEDLEERCSGKDGGVELVLEGLRVHAEERHPHTTLRLPR